VLYAGSLHMSTSFLPASSANKGSCPVVARKMMMAERNRI